MDMKQRDRWAFGQISYGVSPEGQIQHDWLAQRLCELQKKDRSRRTEKVLHMTHKLTSSWWSKQPPKTESGEWPLGLHSVTFTLVKHQKTPDPKLVEWFNIYEALQLAWASAQSRGRLLQRKKAFGPIVLFLSEVFVGATWSHITELKKWITRNCPGGGGTRRGLDVQSNTGMFVDLYLQQKCSTSNGIISSKDHTSNQMNVAKAHKVTGVFNGQIKTYAICRAICRMEESDDSFLWLTKANGIIS